MSEIINVTSQLEQNGYLSTMKVETEEQKALYYNATSSPDFRISDCINKTINVKDIFVEMVEMEKKLEDGTGTGEFELVPRIVLIDTDGRSYTAVSKGVFAALRRLCMVYGMPTWESGISIMVMQVTRGKNKMLTLKVVA